jgi:triosephosphate isomerase
MASRLAPLIYILCTGTKKDSPKEKNIVAIRSKNQMVKLVISTQITKALLKPKKKRKNTIVDWETKWSVGHEHSKEEALCHQVC